VGYTVTATSGLPAAEQGLATGLTTMTQLVALTIGIPVIGAVAGGTTLAGLHRGLLVDVAATAVAAVLIWAMLRPRVPGTISGWKPPRSAASSSR
jgi:hypothetical protein